MDHTGRSNSADGDQGAFPDLQRLFAGDRSAHLALVMLKKLMLLIEGTKPQWAGVTTNRPT